MSRRLRVIFAGVAGPAPAELWALRGASAALSREPIHTLASALRGVPEIVVETESDEADQALTAAGMRVEVPEAYGAPLIERALVCSPLENGELRWLFMPSFDPEAVLTAHREDSRWLLSLHAARASVHGRLHPWRVGQPIGEAGHDAWVIEAEVREDERRLLDTWRSSPPTARTGRYLDGMPIELRRREGDTVSSEHVHHPSAAQPRERAVERLGLALAERFDDPDAQRLVARLARYVAR